MTSSEGAVQARCDGRSIIVLCNGLQVT